MQLMFPTFFICNLSWESDLVISWDKVFPDLSHMPFSTFTAALTYLLKEFKGKVNYLSNCVFFCLVKNWKRLRLWQVLAPETDISFCCQNFAFYFRVNFLTTWYFWAWETSNSLRNISSNLALTVLYCDEIRCTTNLNVTLWCWVLEECNVCTDHRLSHIDCISFLLRYVSKWHCPVLHKIMLTLEKAHFISSTLLDCSTEAEARNHGLVWVWVVQKYVFIFWVTLCWKNIKERNRIIVMIITTLWFPFSSSRLVSACPIKRSRHIVIVILLWLRKYYYKWVSETILLRCVAKKNGQCGWEKGFNSHHQIPLRLNKSVNCVDDKGLKGFSTTYFLSSPIILNFLSALCNKKWERIKSCCCSQTLYFSLPVLSPSH